ncbi:ABC transporter substrate-binding protein [bacterium]|nr:ABC transporter substrate-binding protein [bacterium]
MKHQTFIRRIFVCLIGLSLISCGPDKKSSTTDDDSKPEYGGTLIYAKNGPPISLDPAATKETESSVIVASIFDGLVEQQAGKAAINPALAKSWNISKDGLTYTFNLRTGVTFHDGTPFNADAVLFSFNRQKDPKHPGYTTRDAFEYWKNFDMDKVVRTIAAVNDSTVEFKLSKPDATFLNLLTINFAAIVSPEAVKKYKNDFYKNPVGTGAFKFSSWNDDGSVVCAAFENFMNGRPYADTLVFKPIPDGHQRWLELKAGTVNMMSTPGQADLAEIENTSGVKMAKQHGINVAYLAMNMSKKPFTDLRVRQAIVYAINREQLVKEVYGQLGRPAKNPIPPVLLGYNEEIRFTPYNPEKSKELLKEAGFPNGFKTKLLSLPIVREYMPNGQLTAEFIQKELKAVGIEVEIVSYEWKEVLARRERGDHELALAGWVGDAPDPHFFFFPLLDKVNAKNVGSTNAASYKSEEMHNLIEKGKITFEPVERSNVYKKACEVFNKDLPWFTIAHSVSIVPMRDNVMDFVLHSSSVRKFDKVWLKK